MRERLTPSGRSEMPSSEKETLTFERRAVRSLLEGPNGEHTELSIAISEQDGELRGANFWDLDKTLIVAEPIHAQAIERIFPEQAKDETSRQDLHKVFFDGFTLGNSFREFDRMWRIYQAGEEKYKDVRIYEEEFVGKETAKQKLIDEPGHPEGYHERASEILQRYGKIGYEVIRQAYEKDPDKFRDSFLKPEILQLLIEKTRLGQANVYMTANSRDLARGFVAYSGLYKYGLALATDETMAGGGKEIAIKQLIKELDDLGLKVNKQRAAAIGDSIKGDVGSGAKAGLASGVLVVETTDSIDAILERAKSESSDGEQIKSALEGTSVEAIPTKEVAKSKAGIYRFGKKSSQKKS